MALIFIAELVQGRVLEVLNLGFGIEIPDVIALLGLVIIGRWYVVSPFFAIAHALANPGLAYIILPRDLIALALTGLAIQRIKSSEAWITFLTIWAPTSATILAIVLDSTGGVTLDSGLGFLQGIATSLPAAVATTFIFFALEKHIISTSSLTGIKT
jgi:hypothetical protein